MKKKILNVFLFISILLSISSCHFISSFTEIPEVELSFDKSTNDISIGEMDIVNLKTSGNQNQVSIKWEYDESIIMAKTDNYSAVITGLKPGTTTLKASCGPNSASCLITVSDTSYAVTISNPYVYASTDYVELKPNQTQKISASLFGGTPSDINGYTWSIDKPSVASLSTEGNYCWITGVNDGVAKLTVKHNKTAYGYSVLINCSSDGSTLTYITTDENIITINKSEENTAEFAVDLMNPLVTNYESGFTYSVVDELGNEVNGALIISGAGSLNVSLTAYEVGNYYVRCSHPSAIYYLDVLVRVIENAETAYIEPSSGSQITIHGNESQNITLSLMNYSKDVDSSLFSWSFSENADKYISYEIYNGTEPNTGDNILIKGIKTGSCKITVSYPGLPDRSIIVLVRDIASEAASAKTYITTSQNYIKLGLNDEASNISITLTESKDCDINELKWSIINCASDGSTKDVIQWVVGTGTSISSSVNSRAILVENARAYATIKPVNPGIAYIDISHPKAIYKTRITVTVTEESSVTTPSSSLSLTGSPVVNILNGETKTISVSLTGDGDSSEIEWNSSNELITVTPNGSECVINSPSAGSGVQKATITATHQNATYPVKFSVLCYDTEEELQNNALKAMYSLETSAELYVNNQIQFYVYTEGFSENQSISWSCTQGSDLISFETTDNNKVVMITANKVGKAILKASSDGVDDVFFVINIKDINIIDDENSCYLSTFTNVLYFEDKDISQDLVISAYNINESSYSDIVFSCDSPYFEIASNGNKATVTSLAENQKAVLTVSHPLSENTLEIYLHCGEQYEYINEDFCFISTDKDTIELYAGQDDVQLTATLNHTEVSDEEGIAKGFTFTSDNPDVVSVSYVTYSNYCYVTPIKNGTAKITITHPDSDFEKEVIVIVNHAPDVSTIPYITTKTNVITVIQGEYATASVELKNSTSIDSSKWTWTTTDSRICDVVANNGTSSMISANKPGTTEITVKHEDCIYSLKLIIVVLDSSVITSRPYIKSSDNIITLKKGTSTTITAEMIGGTSASDKNYFRFNGSNSSIIMVNGVSDSAYIKGINTGMAYVTISNARYSDSYSKTVLVIVEDTQEEGVYIKPSSNIVKMKPDEHGLIKITAELIGGEATDGERFIWWVDDPNLIGITSIADQCSIMPTGKTGTTKIHIKHEKAIKTCDILVMVSDYETFAFSQLSANISSEKLYFIPLQVPAIEEEYEIQYFSSNEDVCIVQGSNAVAWVCGVDYGNASLTAKMMSKDGVELASSEMLVTVTVPDVKLPTISLGNSIITVEAGTSKTFSAVIKGEDIDETEKYNLKWSWVCGKGDSKNGISILDETPDKTAFGPDTYITFNEEGEYVLYVTHEATGAVSSMYVIVEDKGEVSIELSSYLETIYKDDGSISITANLINGSESDYKNIEWSAIKVGGQNIVAVSKAKGKTCTITPKNVGQTSVIAKLPNGKTAKCVVIVKAAAELTLDVGTLHVIPGYTEVVNYKTTPENATINWITQMTNMGMDNTKYFSFEDDKAKRQLRITGIQDYPGGSAGTISGYIMGASSGNMVSVNVFVEYDMELSLLDMKGNRLTRLDNKDPDTENVTQFQVKYYPIDLDIDIFADSPSGTPLACIPYENNTLGHTPNNEHELLTIGDVQKQIITEDGINKCLMTVSVVPHYEGETNLYVTATLPNSKAGIHSKTEEFLYTAYYKEYELEIDLDKYTPVGSFTRYSASEKSPNYKDGDELGTLYIGDGEEAVFTVRIANENAAGSILANDYEWITDGLGNPYSRANEVKLTTDSTIKNKESDRLRKAKAIFGTTITSAQEVAKGDKTAEFGVVSISTENPIEGYSVFRIAHNWDFYKDLPSDVVGPDASTWENYKNANVYNDNFISQLKKKGVDYWLITKEMYAKINNEEYYMTAHDSVPNNKKLTAYWTKGEDYDHWWGSCFGPHWKRWRDWIRLQGVSIYGSYTELFYMKNNSGDNYNYEPLKGDPYGNGYSYLKYKSCIPYVITTEELLSNQFFVRPDGYTDLHYNRNKNNKNYSDYWIKIKKLMHEYATPTVSKDNTKVKSEDAFAKLNIKYQIANSSEIKTKTINITFEKRNCEAYTNNQWEQESCSGKWVLSEELFDGNVNENTPYFEILDNQQINTTTSEIVLNDDILKVPYEVYPSTASLIITIPQNNGSLFLKSGTYDSKSGNTYTISNHEITKNGLASGFIYFINNGTYSDKVFVEAKGNNLNVNNNINIEITSEINYIPKINSQTGIYSRYDASKRILIIGDGETISGNIIQTDKSLNKTISNIYFENISSMSDFPLDTETDTLDSTGKTQSTFVSCTVGSSGSASSTFTISHSFDYGYYATNLGIVDRMYRKEFSLEDISIDESKVSYETVYDEVDINQDGVISEDEKIINLEITEANKQSAILAEKQSVLHDLKKTYVIQNSNPQTSYTFPYYYENNNFVFGEMSSDDIKTAWIPKTENVTLVGRIVIDYGETDVEGQKITQEIFVAVEVRNKPCMETSSYGYEVPSSYYNSITE